MDVWVSVFVLLLRAASCLWRSKDMPLAVEANPVDSCWIPYDRPWSSLSLISLSHNHLFYTVNIFSPHVLSGDSCICLLNKISVSFLLWSSLAPFLCTQGPFKTTLSLSTSDVLFSLRKQQSLYIYTHAHKILMWKRPSKYEFILHKIKIKR